MNEVGDRKGEWIWTKRGHLQIVKETAPQKQDEPAHILTAQVDYYRIEGSRLYWPEAGRSGSHPVGVLKPNGTAPARAARVGRDVGRLQAELIDSWNVMGEECTK